MTSHVTKSTFLHQSCCVLCLDLLLDVVLI